MMKNGSSISTSTNSKTVRKTYQGRCLAILRPLGSPAETFTFAPRPTVLNWRTQPSLPDDSSAAEMIFNIAL